MMAVAQATQDAPEEVRNRDFRRELEERERVAAREKNRDRPTRGIDSMLMFVLFLIVPYLIPAILDEEQEQKAEEERIRMENILSGNPLLNLTGPAQPQANFKVKRRWDDDVVFKNCAKGIDETKKDKRFVNDTLRSEFHKKFMEKYIK
ncbi:UNVERIFIED_CONTAM: hypothetical protein H355_006178 [Colinus virginianus]|nr:hypothetical protein H355_006178 [Colinus virginianus]